MAKIDHRINEHGVNVNDLKAGQWVTVRWNDAGDVKCLLLEIEEHPKTYKGERCIKVFDGPYVDDSWNIQTRAVHTQVVAIHGFLNTKPVKSK